MRKYETFYLSDGQSDLIEKINSRVKEVVEQNQGVFVKAETWGTRQLAYHIKRKQQGNYIRLEYDLNPAQVSEINRVLKFQEGIIRFRTHVVEGETVFAPYEPSEQFAREPRHFVPSEGGMREVPAPASVSTPAPAAPAPVPETAAPAAVDPGKAEKQEAQ